VHPAVGVDDSKGTPNVMDEFPDCLLVKSDTVKITVIAEFHLHQSASSKLADTHRFEKIWRVMDLLPLVVLFRNPSRMIRDLHCPSPPIL
jgi:hypothetical protein